MLWIKDLAREPEFHLDQLLEVLAGVPDGFTTRREDVWVCNRKEAGWMLEAGGYGIGVQPDYSCGFDEEGDGKILTALLTRLTETEGQASLTTAPVFREPVGMDPYFAVGWRAGVKLGEASDSPMTHKVGVAWADKPGTAVLVAYLMAWGVVS